MIIEALAAAAVSAAPAAKAEAPTQVAPVTIVPPPELKDQPVAATITVPVNDTAGGLWASAWPEGAYQAGISGRVWLSCEIDRFGIAEWCKVAAEKPEGRGFGAAALALRPTL
jgi:hypothetical protein